MVTSNVFTKPPTPAPTVRCCQCGAELMAAWQPPLIDGRAGYWLLTCDSEGCPLHMQTFTDAHYPPEPERLQKYLVGAKARAK